MYSSRPAILFLKCKVRHHSTAAFGSMRLEIELDDRLYQIEESALDMTKMDIPSEILKQSQNFQNFPNDCNISKLKPILCLVTSHIN